MEPAKWEEKEEQCPAYTLTKKIRARRAENACTEKSVLCCIVSSGESSVPWPNAPDGVAQAWKPRWWRFKLSVPFSDDLRTWLFELDVYGKSTMGHQKTTVSGRLECPIFCCGRSSWPKSRVACPSNRWPGFELLRSRHDNEKLLQKALLQHQPRIEPRPLQAPDRDSDRDEEKVATPRQSRYQAYIYDFNSIITGCVQPPDSDQEQPDQEPGLELANGRALLKNHRVLLSTISSSESMQCAGIATAKAIDQQAQSKKGMGALNLPLVKYFVVRVHEQLLLLEMFF
ncbi:hypothetical protein SELMODRAFT_429663 [Selaginella moellendorffii]|uniref:Uncharacterized protein n=1 Tax=Selaginella moellendorffii TaxID=88036 RepID=D8T6W9_SELML|nr:hypothetical protein SELMODRAFT_429663 [Selaginella moellendorffii]